MCSLTHHVGGSLGRCFKLDHGLSVSHRNKFSRMCGVQKEPPQDVPQRCAHSFELTAQEKLLPLNHLEERKKALPIRSYHQRQLLLT